MSEKTNGKEVTYKMYPIGAIHRNGNDIYLDIDETYRPALKTIDHYSHVMVFWWADQLDSEEYRSTLQCNPPYASDILTGIFATRSPVRPNPISMTTCKLLEVDEEAGRLKIADIDAFDGTPVVDLKAYYPVCDRVQEATIPEWLSDWPEWMPEDGIGLMEEEG